MKQKKILYVNYSPYENQGKILDYLREEFRYVFLVSISHHNIGKKKITNRLTIYKSGNIIRQVSLFYIPVPEKLVFILLPLRSFILVFQLVLLGIQLKREYQKIDFFFTVNGYLAWIGLVLKKISLVSRSIYWICDYYPIKHKKVDISLMRWLYWQFERQTVSSDILAFHNMRLVDKWKELGVTIDSGKTILVPIGTSKEKNNKNKPRGLSLCFLGVLKKSQGIDFILKGMKLIQQKYPRATINIIGPGPDTAYFKNKSNKLKLNTIFHGYVTEDQMDDIISSCKIGLALYMPDPSHVSYYGDPGKIKKYISHKLPVIATNIHEFTAELENRRAGELVQYENIQELISAVEKINMNYSEYSANVEKLRNKYFYKKIYQKMFEI